MLMWIAKKHFIRYNFQGPHAFIQPNLLSLIILLKGIIPENEIRNPKTLDKVNDIALPIVIFGCSSKFSCGLVNAIKSVLRKLYQGLELYSEDWCIIRQRKIKRHFRHAEKSISRT